MNRNHVNYIIDVGMGLAFIASAVTGIIKFPGLLQRIGIAPRLNFYYINIIHDWSGLVLAVLVLVHLILHWKWIKEMTVKIFQR